jgi:hypothetical protein
MANENKNIVLAFYTFQLSTTENHGEVELLDGSKMTIKEIAFRKNELLSKALREKKYEFRYKRIKLNHKLIFVSEPYFIFKIANYKSLKIERDFQDVFVDTEPSIFVIVYNTPEKQTIAIQNEYKAFTSVDRVAEVIENTFRYILHEYHLKPAIRNTFDEQEFWALIKNYNNRITSIRFEFVKENNPDLYNGLADDLADFSKEINSHKTVQEFNAPPESVLENITPQNKKLEEFVSTAANGTSPIKVKVLGKTHYLSTKNKTIVKEFPDIEITAGTVEEAQQIVKILDQFFK